MVLEVACKSRDGAAAISPDAGMVFAHYNGAAEDKKLLSASVRKKAFEAWSEYEKAIVDAWKFPKDARLFADGLMQAIESFDDARMEKLIQWLREQSEEIRSMEWVGEP